jgi:hypothetical protein
MMLRGIIFALALSTALPSNRISLHHSGDVIHLDGTSFKISSRVSPHALPKVTLLRTNGIPALSFSIGKTEPDLFEMSDSDVGGTHAPSVQTFLIKGPTPDLDVLLPVAMVTGGSDCGYEATVIGVTNGRPKQWLGSQAFVNSQGGYYVGDLGNGRGYGFAAWNFRWEDGAHYGPHRYEVTLYRLIPGTGRAVRIVHLESKQKHNTDIKALHELGLNYKNLLRSDSSFGC